MARARNVSLREDIAQCVTLIAALESGKLNDVDHPQARILEQKRKLAGLEFELARSAASGPLLSEKRQSMRLVPR